MEEEEIPKFKVVILGDAGVGKTSIARRQSQGTFDFKMNPTVGASHMKSSIKINGKTIELMLWDTAGHEQFASLVPMYARNADVAILVASIVHPDSCEHLQKWLDYLHDANENPPVIVAINKIDLLEGAPMTMEEVRETYCEKFPKMFFVSARTGDSIDQLFLQAATEAISFHKREIITEPKELQPQEESSGCC